MFLKIKVFSSFAVGFSTSDRRDEGGGLKRSVESGTGKLPQENKSTLYMKCLGSSNLATSKKKEAVVYPKIY